MGGGGGEYITPRIDTAGRTVAISDRTADACAAGPSAVLTSRGVRFKRPPHGEGADVLYDISYHRSMAEESAQSYRGGSAIRRQGREQPVFRRDAGAMGWGTQAGAAGSDPMMGGLSKLHRQRQRAVVAAASAAGAKKTQHQYGRPPTRPK